MATRRFDKSWAQPCECEELRSLRNLAGRAVARAPATPCTVPSGSNFSIHSVPHGPVIVQGFASHNPGVLYWSAIPLPWVKGSG